MSTPLKYMAKLIREFLFIPPLAVERIRLIRHPSLDFHSLNTTSTTIFVNSTGNLDCDAFAKSVVNTTSYYLEETGVSCTSKMGTVNLTHVEPPIPEVTSGAFKIQGGFLTMTALLGYILAL